MIEAAPERAELKRDLFGALSMVCGDEVVLATNTSSIPVTSLAGAAARPENVVGMHFFNPPPLMPLLEVIRAEQSSDAVVERAIAVGEAMGKEVIVAADGPGFLVNRCGRPFNAEGLRLLQERVASHEQIDRICRLGGGFRMGPFELMDLVGIDVGFEVAVSFNELAFGGEPRWRPSPIQARMVEAGRLGRKTGRGFYDYTSEGTCPVEDPDPPEPGGGEGLLLTILGDGPVADDLRERGRAAGYELREGSPTELVLDAGVRPHPSPPGGAPVGLLCVAGSLSSRGEPGAVGFHVLPGSALVELTRLPTTQDFAAQAVAECFGRLGFVTEWVDDAPGLVLGRIVCQLVNEAAFAIGEGVGSPDDVDGGSPSASHTRAAPWSGARRSAWSTCSRCSTGCGRSAARSATGPRRCSGAPRRPGVAFGTHGHGRPDRARAGPTGRRARASTSPRSSAACARRSG